VLCALCFVLCALCFVLCALCFVLCALCFVLCCLRQQQLLMRKRCLAGQHCLVQLKFQLLMWSLMTSAVAAQLADITQSEWQVDQAGLRSHLMHQPRIWPEQSHCGDRIQLHRALYLHQVQQEGHQLHHSRLPKGQDLWGLEADADERGWKHSSCKLSSLSLKPASLSDCCTA